MLCLVALVVFSVLGIFSASYRPLAKEAFNCVFRKITFRSCNTGFDQKIKTKVTSKLMRFPALARMWFKHFQIVSWLFTILFFASFAYSAYSLYNLYTYGSCDPHSDFCVFNLEQTGPSCGSSHCAEKGCTCGGKEQFCTPGNNYSACEGNCDCNKEVCG